MDTSHFTRHVGKMANTDQRIVIAFMQIREKPDHALVIPVDNLHPRFEQAIMDVLHTSEGQQPGPFALVLGRHRMPDTGETILEALHRQGKLQAVPVHQVLMLPAPNMPMKLSTILEQQGLMQQQVDPNYETEKFNPHLNNQRAETSENVRAAARNLLREAEDLEAIANSKRAQAYTKDPSLQTTHPTARPFTHNANPWTSSPSSFEGAATPMTEVVSLPENISSVLPLESVDPTGAIIVVDPIHDRISELETMVTKLAETLLKITDQKEGEKVVNTSMEA